MQKDKSFMGYLYEQRIFERLKTVNNASIFRNIRMYSPKLKKNTEIDICLVSDKGVFVLEIKRYTTFIKGNRDDMLWSVASSGSFRKKYNFCCQNEHHVRVLHFYLERFYGKDVPIYNFIICPDNTKIVSNCDNIMNLMDFMSIYRDIPVHKNLRLNELIEVISLLKKGGSTFG